MELMDNLTSIAATIPKLVEFPEHFILNTQLYDKQTLKPVPMKFYVNNLCVPYMLLQTSITKTNYYSHNYYLMYIQNNNEYNRQNIIQDKNDSSIFYTIQYGHNSISNTNISNTNMCDETSIYKIQYNKDTKKYVIINSFSVTKAQPYTGQTAAYNNAQKGDIKILYETDDYFVLNVVAQHSPSTNVRDYAGMVFLLNKKSFEYTYITGTHAYYRTYFLEVNDDLVYILNMINAYTIQITKVNISSKTSTVIWTDTPTNTSYGIWCNPVQIDNYHYVLTGHLDENNSYLYKIMKIKLDTSTDTVSTELLDIDLNGFVIDSSTNSDMNYSYYVIYTLKVIKTDSNIYLSCLMHTVPNMTTEYNYQHKHVLLKFNGTGFTVVDVVPLTDGCYGSLTYNDSKHQVWYMSNCALFYVFDETKEKMVCTYKKPGMFMQIGFDSLNRFITQTSDKTIEILTNTNACTLKADFNEELYDKDDTTDIDTAVSFYAKNFLDEYIETSVKLTLVGPVIFKDSESKELIISTLSTGIREIPVTITGYGSIEVIITQNT